MSALLNYAKLSEIDNNDAMADTIALLEVLRIALRKNKSVLIKTAGPIPGVGTIGGPTVTTGLELGGADNLPGMLSQDMPAKIKQQIEQGMSYSPGTNIGDTITEGAPYSDPMKSIATDYMDAKGNLHSYDWEQPGAGKLATSPIGMEMRFQQLGQLPQLQRYIQGIISQLNRSNTPIVDTGSAMRYLLQALGIGGR